MTDARTGDDTGRAEGTGPPEDRAARDSAKLAATRARRAATTDRGPVDRRPRPPDREVTDDGPDLDDPGTASASKAGPTDAGDPTVAGAVGEHNETTAFLLDSIRDLDAERAAGDIDDDDYRTLRDDYTRRAARALRAEAKGRSVVVAPPRRRSPWHWAAIVVGIVGFAVLAGVLVAQASGQRETGEGITGEVTQSPTQAAARCINLTVEWQAGTEVIPQAAFDCYEEVLAEDPDNAVALAYLAWTQNLLAQEYGPALGVDQLGRLFAEVDGNLERALEVDADYPDALAFRVVVAAQREDWDEAAARLEAFDAIDAPADMVTLVDGLRDRITEGVAGDGSTTTVPATSPP